MGRVTNACFRTSERWFVFSQPILVPGGRSRPRCPVLLLSWASLIVPNSLVFPSIGLGPNYLVWYNENVEVG